MASKRAIIVFVVSLTGVGALAQAPEHDGSLEAPTGVNKTYPANEDLPGVIRLQAAWDAKPNDAACALYHSGAYSEAADLVVASTHGDVTGSEALLFLTPNCGGLR